MRVEWTIANSPHSNCIWQHPKIGFVLSLKFNNYHVQLPNQGRKDLLGIKCLLSLNWGSHWIDQEVVVAEQLVILGAGLDTRAYRLPALTNVPVFEVDFQEVLEAKARFLKTLWIRNFVESDVKLYDT